MMARGVSPARSIAGARAYHDKFTERLRNVGIIKGGDGAPAPNKSSPASVEDAIKVTVNDYDAKRKKMMEPAIEDFRSKNSSPPPPDSSVAGPNPEDFAAG